MKNIFDEWKEGYELTLRRRKGWRKMELPKGYSFREAGLNELTKGDERNFLRLYGGLNGERLKRFPKLVGDSDFIILWLKITDEHIGFVVLVMEEEGKCRLEWPNVTQRWNRGGAYEALVYQGMMILKREKYKKLRVKLPSRRYLNIWRKIAKEELK